MTPMPMKATRVEEAGSYVLGLMLDMVCSMTRVDDRNPNHKLHAKCACVTHALMMLR
jgi:hypothetical protein